MIASFLFFLLLFVCIGLSSASRLRNSEEDYYLASHQLGPWQVGLSAVATNNSGYMFIGLIAYVWVEGLATVWLLYGWIFGDYIASRYIHAPLRQAAVRTGELSYMGVLSNWHGERQLWLQRCMALVSALFLLAYASAQFVAGSKALMVLLEWPEWGGVLLSAFLVCCYCVFGGIRASVWTDCAQSIVMLLAMLLLVVVGFQFLGGLEQGIAHMSDKEGLLDLVPGAQVVPGVAGWLLFVVGWMFGGISVVGQPHIMVRFMMLEEVDKMREARAWYYLWFVVFASCVIVVGLLARVCLGDTGISDPELALPFMARELLPPILVGLILAGIFAATMSTADSLVLSCSAALSNDLFPHRVDHTLVVKLLTFSVTVVAVLWALLNKQTVFDLVIMAWSGMGSAFVPLLLFLCLGRKPKTWHGLCAIVTGLGTALLWRVFGLHDVLYEGLPGVLVGLLMLFIGEQISRWTSSRTPYPAAH